MLGVPEGDHEQMKDWSSDIIRSLDAIGIPSDDSVVERGRVGRRGIAEYFRALLPERRRHPRADLLSSLIAAEEQGDRLTEGELLATCVLLFIGGHETTVTLSGNGLLALLRHRGELARLRAEPGLIGSAVEELLRFDSPVQRTARITNADVVVGGKTLPAGAFVVTAIGAANRDPRQFPEPDRLDIGRTENRHIAFGFGIHFCLGAPLARVEGPLALGAPLRRGSQARPTRPGLEGRRGPTP